MNWLYAVAVGMLPAGLVAYGGVPNVRQVWKHLDRTDRLQTALVMMLVIMLSGGSGAAAYFPLKLNMLYYASVHYSLVIASSIVFLVSVRYRRLWPGWALGLSLAIPAALLVVAVPSAILPYFRSGTAEGIAEVPTGISTKPVIESVERMQEALANVEEQVSVESKNIDNLMRVLVQEIEAKNEQLTSTRMELERLSKEVEHYKTLASLSEEQAQAVVDALNRARYIDYFVGFISGLASSAVVFVIQLFLKRIRQQS